MIGTENQRFKQELKLYSDGKYALRNDKENSQNEKISTDNNRLTISCNRFEYYGSVNTVDQPHGYGIMRYHNGSCYDGDWINGLRNGIGKMTILFDDDHDGMYTAIYDGFWKQDRKHGMGALTTYDGVYKGKWKDDKKHGKGTYTSCDGSIYEGDFADDMKNGIGIIKYPNGAVFQGGFMNDERKGEASFLYHNGTVFEGQYNHDKKNGRGKLTYVDGLVFEGCWIDGKQIPHGLLKYPSGEVFEGITNGRYRNGEGFLRRKNGDEINAHWTNDQISLLHQPVTIKYIDGNVYTGCINDSCERHGKGKLVLANDGGKFDGDWQFGEFTGTGTRLYPTGVEFTGCWSNSSRPNNGIEKYPDGNIYNGDFTCISGSFYRDGSGTMEYKNGDRYEGEWRLGLITGYGVMLYKNGDLYSGEWVESKRQGKGSYEIVPKTITPRMGIGSGYNTNSIKMKNWNSINNECAVSSEVTRKSTASHHSDDSLSGINHLLSLVSVESMCETSQSIGLKYNGQFMNDKFHGKGHAIYSIAGRSYVGDWVEGERHGEGTETFPDKSSYRGTFVFGARHGFGLLTLADSSFYSGPWVNDEKHGPDATFFSAAGDLDDPGTTTGTGTYRGPFSHNKRQGMGQLIYPNGDKYEGMFENDLPNDPHGVFQYDDGGFYEGPVINGFCTGLGYRHYSDGSEYRGFFTANRRNGFGVFTTSISVYEGGWKDDKRTGFAFMQYANGNTFRGRFEFDKRNGAGVFREEGSMSIGTWLMNQKHGIFLKATEVTGRSSGCSKGQDLSQNKDKGSCKSLEVKYNEEMWQQNKMVDSRRAVKFSNGCVYAGEMREGLLAGEGAMIFPSPQGLLFEDVYVGSFANDQRHGRGVQFFNSLEVYQGMWDSGNRSGSGSIFYPDGSLFSGLFTKDQMHGNGLIRFARIETPMSSKVGPSMADKFPKELSYEGDFEFGVRCGHGVTIYLSGAIHDGDYQADYPNGEGKLILPTGDLYVGGFVNGKKHGVGFYSTADGMTSKGSYKQGKLIDII